MEPLDCSCRYFVDPKAPKWSPWGAAGGTLGVLWWPRTLQNGVKMGALGASGDPVGGQGGSGKAQGTKKYQVRTSFWSHFETKMCSKADMENSTKNKYMFATIADGTEA